MAISLPQKRPMSRRDCHATLAMTAWQKLGTREIPIADHRRSADPLPTEPVPPQHRSTHHHQQRAPSGVQRRCCHKRRRELHGRRRNPRTTHPRDVNRRRGHRPTLRPSHRPPQQLLQRLVRHRPRGTRTTRQSRPYSTSCRRRSTSDGFAGGHRRQRTQRRRRPAPSAKSAIPHRTTAGNKGQKWQSLGQSLPKPTTLPQQRCTQVLSPIVKNSSPQRTTGTYPREPYPRDVHLVVVDKDQHRANPELSSLLGVKRLYQPHHRFLREDRERERVSPFYDPRTNPNQPEQPLQVAQQAFPK